MDNEKFRVDENKKSTSLFVHCKDIGLVLRLRFLFCIKLFDGFFLYFYHRVIFTYNYLLNELLWLHHILFQNIAFHSGRSST